MEHQQYAARGLDRALANAGALRTVFEAFLLAVILFAGIAYFASHHSHQERVALLSDKLASDEAVLAEYRLKLNGATPAEAATHIERLTDQIAALQTDVSERPNKLAARDNQPRDPHRLYEDNNPIARVEPPQVDLDRRVIVFPMVTSDIILGINQSYEFQDWKLACGGTRLYNSIKGATAGAYSYAPLTCKIMGHR